MDDDGDPLDELETMREHQREWLRRLKTAQHIAPQVQASLDVTEWEIQALSKRPDEADEIPLAGLSGTLSRERKRWEDGLPMLPEYDWGAISMATSTAGSATVYEFVSRVGDLDTHEARTYSEKWTGEYQKLQTTQNRQDQVRALLLELGNPGTLERFDRAFRAYSSAKSGLGERTSAAGEMRTLLDGVKGDLFERARKWPKENMTWQHMASRLSKDRKEGPAYQELLQQEKHYTSLFRRLSDVLKDRESNSLTNVDHLWTQLLDHLYTVLSLVHLEDS